MRQEHKVRLVEKVVVLLVVHVRVNMVHQKDLVHKHRHQVHQKQTVVGSVMVVMGSIRTEDMVELLVAAGMVVQDVFQM